MRAPPWRRLFKIGGFDSESLGQIRDEMIIVVASSRFGDSSEYLVKSYREKGAVSSR